MPRTPEKIQEQLGISREDHTWDSLKEFGRLKAGTKIQKGEIIFPRLDAEKELEALEDLKNEKAKKEQAASEGKKTEEKKETETPDILPEITIDDFAKLDLRVARVVAAERVEKTDKLLKLTLDVGGKSRQVVSGIAQYYSPEELIGQKLILVANLKPVKLRGIPL